MTYGYNAQLPCWTHFHGELMNTITCPNGVGVSVDEAGYNGLPRSVDDLLELLFSIHGGHLVIVINGGDPPVSN